MPAKTCPAIYVFSDGDIPAVCGDKRIGITSSTPAGNNWACYNGHTWFEPHRTVTEIDMLMQIIGPDRFTGIPARGFAN